MNYSEYCTVANVRTVYLEANQSTDDALILDIIRQVSREIDRITHRHFYPLISSRYYNLPAGDLLFDDDLLEITGNITNGDGASISTGQYALYPLNSTPKWKLSLYPGYQWQASGTSGSLSTVTVPGVWGYYPEYSSAWLDAGAVLAAAITTTTATTFTTTSAAILANTLIKIDSEYLYVTAVSGTGTKTATVVRGVNGSTAAAHLIAAPVTTWQPWSELDMLARQASAAYYRLRSNPGMDTLVLDGTTIQTPRDVDGWLLARLRKLGMIREAFG